ncbi:hypothetical protein AVEN_169218-1 [Araneus ventricosus]|uniref:Helitron helicase-like domain-containing protein n=1 Tax=Araneus ventricosus TaxID=182803 RepID=A0A4Y2KDR1_ARAVE|nr:hypothetical protein AVEN_169218-1 [Araneus ventricosus]
MNIICQFCKSKNFAAELPSDGKFTSCCRKGKIKLEKPSDALVNGQAPQYFQLYVIDSTQDTEIRVNHPANEQCHIRILDQIDRFIRHHNRLSNTYRMLREVQSQKQARIFPL